MALRKSSRDGATCRSSRDTDPPKPAPTNVAKLARSTLPPAANAPEHEPDYRFTLANERTFLAWVRTALALLAGAVALAHFARPLTERDPDKLLGLALVMASILAILYATWHWHRVQQAMRRDAPLPGGGAIWFLSGLVVLTGGFAGLTALLCGTLQ
ncbi:DUF202 domain-containing protein [Thioclava sp. BHET1]|nr:DUF202 domain-containing protein [Thioclava sp. BHET1]